MNLQTALSVFRSFNLNVGDLDVEEKITDYLQEYDEGGYLEEVYFEFNLKKEPYQLFVSGDYNLGFEGYQTYSPATYDLPEDHDLLYRYQKHDIEAEIHGFTITNHATGEEYDFESLNRPDEFTQEEWDDFWQKINQSFRQ